jgi:hypothetical protein
VTRNDDRVEAIAKDEIGSGGQRRQNHHWIRRDPQKEGAVSAI